MRGMGVAGSHPMAKDIVQIFLKSGIYCKYYPNPKSMKWSKLVTNLLGNSSSAILNLSPAQIYSNPALYQIEIEQVREALNVMQIQGIKAVNLPGVPVKILAALIKYLPYWLSGWFRGVAWACVASQEIRFTLLPIGARRSLVPVQSKPPRQGITPISSSCTTP